MLKSRQRLNLRKKRRRGAVIVEFSLVFILFIVVVMTLMEFGRAMWTYATLAHATRQVARFCMIRGSANPATAAQLQAVVKRHCSSNGLDSSQVVATTTWNDDPSPASISRGDFVEVRLTYPFRFVTAPLILGDNDLPISSTSRMMVAN